jgi:hypothetical protein
MKFLYRLLGGRPMKLASGCSAFYDSIGKIPVGYYQDKLGRLWMGNMQSFLGGWQFGFVRVESQLVRHALGDSGE